MPRWARLWPDGLGWACGWRARARYRPLGPLGDAGRTGGHASRPRAALAESAGAGGVPGAAAEAGQRRGPLPLGTPAEMLAGNLVEGFEMKEDEPWYDHQDLQQGEALDGGRLRAAGLLKVAFACGPRTPGAGRAGAPGRGDRPHLPIPPRRLRSPGLVPAAQPHHPPGLAPWGSAAGAGAVRGERACAHVAPAQQLCEGSFWVLTPFSR